MSNSAHGYAIVDLKDFFAFFAKCEKQHPFGTTEGHRRTSAGEFVFDVLPPIGNRLYPTIWFVDHVKAA
jgi:hypothetical protein